MPKWKVLVVEHERSARRRTARPLAERGGRRPGRVPSLPRRGAARPRGVRRPAWCSAARWAPTTTRAMPGSARPRACCATRSTRGPADPRASAWATSCWPSALGRHGRRQPARASRSGSSDSAGPPPPATTRSPARLSARDRRDAACTGTTTWSRCRRPGRRCWPRTTGGRGAGGPVRTPWAWGVQWHPEVDVPVAGSWAEGDRADHLERGIDQQALLDEIDAARAELDTAWATAGRPVPRPCWPADVP